jgi:hypothetical protein
MTYLSQGTKKPTVTPRRGPPLGIRNDDHLVRSLSRRGQTGSLEPQRIRPDPARTAPIRHAQQSGPLPTAGISVQIPAGTPSK